LRFSPDSRRNESIYENNNSIGISIANGSGDAQGSERGLEYDTMSGLYAEFVEQEVLPLVESKCKVKLTKDPNGRATMGGSSGGSAPFIIMAWYHPDLYHRVLRLRQGCGLELTRPRLQPRWA
jgi:enterochelin esterase-like enzyme